MPTNYSSSILFRSKISLRLVSSSRRIVLALNIVPTSAIALALFHLNPEPNPKLAASKKASSTDVRKSASKLVGGVVYKATPKAASQAATKILPKSNAATQLTVLDGHQGPIQSRGHECAKVTCNAPALNETSRETAPKSSAANTTSSKSKGYSESSYHRSGQDYLQDRSAAFQESFYKGPF
jgi:hypothetical protein